MTKHDWELADVVARELVDRETDTNEFQKAIAFARIQSNKPDANVGQRFFALLNAMVQDGRFLVRSGRTLDYYRDLQTVCGRYLSSYRAATGTEGKKLVEILGWAARLMRYYYTEEGKAEMVARQFEAPPIEDPPPAEAPARPIRMAPKPVPPKPKKPAPQIETRRETVTLKSNTIGRKARVVTDQGEEVTCAAFDAYPIVDAGAVCEADVTYENGRPIRAIFRGWK